MSQNSRFYLYFSSRPWYNYRAKKNLRGGKAMYKTEAHIHTLEVSRCGKTPAAKIVGLYAERGFDTIFITDHINSNFPSWDGLSWVEKVDKFFTGYEAARKEGERLGVRVLFGAEIAFQSPGVSSNDYLVYGIDRDFLIGLEEYHGKTIKEFYPYAKAHGVTVLQAHPYREGCFPTPDYVDGCEIFNAHPRHNSHNDKALALAKERGFIMTVGSDVHMEGDVARAYIMTDEPITSAEEYIEAIRCGKARFVTPKD